MFRFFFFVGLVLLVISCRSPVKEKGRRLTEARIVIQPFTGFPANLLDSLLPKLRLVFGDIQIAGTLDLPKNAYYPPRNRYKADSVLKFLLERNGKDIWLGLTHVDISTRNGNIPDWGVMGLSLCPGKASVVSLYRIKKSNRLDDLYKVVVHELGHAEGLPHCKDESCYMRDAEGGYPLQMEKSFCHSCRKYLVERGWNLPINDLIPRRQG